ncbi:MAG: PAS domain-containing protein, partial [Cyanobacteria bacterium J06632_22]
MAVAIAQLTCIAAEALAVERVSVWLYHDRNDQLIEANTYVLSQRCHTAGRQLRIDDYPDYFSPQPAHQHYQVRESTEDMADSFAQRWLIPRHVGALITVPVYQQGQIAGWVWYEHIDQPRQWRDEEQTFAIAIANLITTALGHQFYQQQQGTVQQHQHRVLLLSDTLKAIGSVPSDGALLQQIAQQIASLYQALSCEIWRYRPDSSAPLQTAAAYAPTAPDSVPASTQPNFVLSPQTEPFLQAVMAASDGLTSEASLSSTPTELGQHWIVLPALYGGQPNGFVSLKFPQAERIPTEQARAHLQDFAIQIGIVLAHAQLLEQEKNQQGTLNRQHKQLQREIIERQQAEQAWQESQRFIQSILDASTNILYVNNFDTGENFYVNRCLTSVLGYDVQDLRDLGPHYLEQLSHPDDILHMRSQRVKLSHLDDGEIVESEYRFRHQHGGWRWLLCRETVFHRDSEGRPTQIFGTATDITQRKQAEVALHEVNRELHRLASIDGLTEVANRRCFDKHLNQEWENLRHSNTPLTLILCDIDY